MGVAIKKYLRKLIQYFQYSMPIKSKLVTVFLLLVTFSLCAFAWLSYISVAKSSAEQIKHSSKQAFRQTVDVLDYRISNILYASDQLALNQNLVEIILRDQNLPVNSTLIADYQQVKEILLGAFDKEEMYRITLLLDESVWYSKAALSDAGLQSIAFADISTFESASKLLASGRKVFWLAPRSSANAAEEGELTISCLRAIRNPEDYTSAIGLLKFELLLSGMNQMISRADVTTYGASFVINSAGELIAYSDYDRANQYLHSVAQYVPKTGEEFWQTITFDNAPLIIGSQSIQNTDWTLVSIISNKDIHQVSASLLHQFLTFLIIVCLVCVFLVVFFADSITYRIRMLTKKINHSSADHYFASMDVVGTDEVSILINSYNSMLTEIDRFTKEQYELGKEVEKAEIKALQAQINPHFLYNSLDLINWIALEKDALEICDVVQDLARFYKLSLSGGLDIVPVRNELALIETYIHLQNRKFDSSIQLLTNVPPEIQNCSIMKMVLQPIVENAIIHGIREKEDHLGMITVDGAFADNDIIIRISDDGVGIPKEKLEKLCTGDFHPAEHGYGIKNVHRRLQLHYGNQYGLSYASDVGVGTTVNIRIPKMPCPQDF